MRVVKNPDKEFVTEMKRNLKANNGYCPCQIEKTPDTKCMCKDFRDMIDAEQTGFCNCGLYEIVED